MNIVGSPSIQQNITNNQTGNLSTTQNSAQGTTGSEVPEEVLQLFVNMIKELLGLLKPEPNSESNSDLGFSLSLPSLPAFSDSESSGDRLLTNSVPLPSMATDSGQEATERPRNTTGTSLNLPPLPSFVSSTNGSLSTAELPKAFNPPGIPSLTGGSTQVPSVNATENATTALDTTKTKEDTTSSSVNPIANTTTTRALNIPTLPSFVSPTTGGLSTGELPKAFNPPAIPSLTGGSADLPSVSASESVLTPSGATTSPSAQSSAVTANKTVFSVPSIPSLLGSSATNGTNLGTAAPALSRNAASGNVLGNVPPVPSLLGSTGRAVTSSSPSGITVPSLTGNSTLSELSSSAGFSADGARKIVDDATGNSNNNKQFSNHFK